MSHRKRRETKQQPSMLPGPAVPFCCLVSFCFWCDIHSIHSVICIAQLLFQCQQKLACPRPDRPPCRDMLTSPRKKFSLGNWVPSRYDDKKGCAFPVRFSTSQMTSLCPKFDGLGLPTRQIHYPCTKIEPVQ